MQQCTRIESPWQWRGTLTGDAISIGVPPSAWLRQAVIVSLTAAVLCPLSLLKDLSALSFLPWPYVYPYPNPNPNPNL